MKPIPLQVAELILVGWIGLTILLIIVFDLSDLSEARFEDDPFSAYRRDPGIIRINIASLLSRVVFAGSLVLMRIKPQYRERFLLYVFFLSGLAASFFQWYELYYGSTFYYGEVRDKQGLAFPLLASAIVTLMIWECTYSSHPLWAWRLKIVLTVLVNVGLYLIWLSVLEAWNLVTH
ncbi:hypothetical protein J2Y45_000709 [Dyadobacter sp. BE34]|uniref:DUF998 domain-containing protein n=1 Tax=Dyadobacter fermentans TaxID=94254 RepID=A0ABU1QRZ2_9BACT|nr:MULTISPECIES: hypothetical protein [Dyadobacter]MDR6803439.1 hypothetical protein [Dyadobacter fermentans]MDR7041180.1 hypothetical protein [Dyadobacter sp. BE242]MDR7195583.1 hypothetical protein [Dyadobacter sp. BE34]MDR7213872.1 hypothetical protein [Dyadobacter sp. BE31]MDR7260990.1 hypothetical protein [Dyadobacter sp. BE32]